MSSDWLADWISANQITCFTTNHGKELSRNQFKKQTRQALHQIEIV